MEFLFPPPLSFFLMHWAPGARVRPIRGVQPGLLLRGCDLFLRDLSKGQAKPNTALPSSALPTIALSRSPFTLSLSISLSLSGRTNSQIVRERFLSFLTVVCVLFLYFKMSTNPCVTIQTCSGRLQFQKTEPTQ